jgi:hypothetical protein
MRILLYWLHLRFSLLRVTSHHQLDLRVRDLVLFTISPCAPIPSVDVVARTSSSCDCDYFFNKYDYSMPQSITFWSLMDYFNNWYDFFVLLQQLVWLFSTTSTTRFVKTSNPNSHESPNKIEVVGEESVRSPRVRDDKPQTSSWSPRSSNWPLMKPRCRYTCMCLQ